MKKLLFVLTVLLTFSSFASTSKEQCARTYLDAYLDLEEIAHSFNTDSSYSDAEFIKDYTVHKAELIARNTDCKFSLSRLEKMSISKCSRAFKEIYDRLNDGVSISRTLFSSRVEEIKMDSSFLKGIRMVKAKTICSIEGLSFN